MRCMAVVVVCGWTALAGELAIAQPGAGTTTGAPQGAHTAPTVHSDAPEWMAKIVPAPDSPEAKAYAAAAKKRVNAEKDLKKIRAQYFRASKNTETRQVGIMKLREYTDPALYPMMLTIFGGEDRDVRNALLDHFADQKTDEADAALAWTAVHGENKDFRSEATKRLSARVTETGSVSRRVQSVIALGLKEPANEPVAAAAHLAQVLHLYDAIPMMINAQVTGGGGGTQDGTDTALAWILVGTQQAFVADLVPVVGDNAVAFDPRLGVVTEGTVMRVIDAVVVTYRVEVNTSLVALSTEGWGGQSTASLGWDNAKWREWYTKEFVPYRASHAPAAAEATPAAPK